METPSGFNGVKTAELGERLEDEGSTYEGGQWCKFRGFHDDGAATRQSRSNLPGPIILWNGEEHE